jgi:periplasmic divalent cation tolerance protein
MELSEPRLPMDFLLVISNFPSIAVARQIGTKVVEMQLAACVNLIPAVESIYIWNGKLETAAEITAVFKTTAASFASLESSIRSLHPYEVPEIIAVPITIGSKGYLDWIARSCRE